MINHATAGKPRFPCRDIVTHRRPNGLIRFSAIRRSNDLTRAFVGDTDLTVTTGGDQQRYRLDGAFLGEFTATSTPMAW